MKTSLAFFVFRVSYWEIVFLSSCKPVSFSSAQNSISTTIGSTLCLALFPSWHGKQQPVSSYRRRARWPSGQAGHSYGTNQTRAAILAPCHILIWSGCVIHPSITHSPPTHLPHLLIGPQSHHCAPCTVLLLRLLQLNMEMDILAVLKRFERAHRAQYDKVCVCVCVCVLSYCVTVHQV